jgi:hypothetical protein
MKFKSIGIGLAFMAMTLSSYAQNEESQFQLRAGQLLNRLADTAAIKGLSGYFGQEFSGPGSRPDPEKHVWSVVIARLKKYGNADTSANRILDKYKNRSPFHFTYIGMARIMSAFPQASNMLALKQTYLQQVWNRTDSYNPWTGEGTENHISMNKTSGYLYAQHSLGNSSFPQAASRLAETKEWLRWFAKQTYSKGTSEWNSSTYESYNLVGWLNLFDFAEDPEVKAIAKAVLDYYALEIAMHCSQGLTGGSESRGNTISWGTGEDYIAWVWFGYQSRLMGPNFWVNQEYSQAMHPAHSQYRPPALTVKLARKEIPLPAFFKNSKPDYGQNKAEFVKQTFYADKSFSLGAAMVPSTGWAGGNSQYCNWKLVSNINPAPSVTPQVVLGGSRFFNDKDGKGKTPWDQYVQHEHVMIQLQKIPSNAATIINEDTLLFTGANGWKSKWFSDFNLRFPGDVRSNPVGFRKGSLSRNISYISYPKISPSGSNVTTQLRANVFFIQLEKSFLAIRSLAQNSPGNPADESSNRSFISDQANQGNLCGLITEAVNASDYLSFTAFQDSILARTSIDKSQIASNKITYINLKGQALEVEFTENGPGSAEPLYDWGFGPVTPQLYQTSPPFLQPDFQGGQGRGKIPVLKVNGNDAGYGNSGWAVFEGPGASVKDSILLLTSDSSGLTVYYQVDFTGNQPIFSSGILTGNQALRNTEVSKLELLPNPASREFTAKARNLSNGEKVTVYVFGMNGALVWKSKDMIYQSGGVNVQAGALKTGAYQVVLKSGSRSYTGRLVLNP